MTENENTSASSTKRIAKNTLMLYFRQILIMLVSLYTVRVILNTLGAEDYGIYNVVAGVVTMFGFLSGAMATASQRFFSFELGKGDNEKLKKTFSVTLCIYLLLILIIVFLAETVGLWFVNHKLVIPPERLTAAKWIYQFSILSFVVTLITTPYMASIIAHENMNVYAYVSIIEAVLKLVIVFVLKTLPYDKLILYGLLLFVVGFINTALYRGYCKKYYKECAFHPVWDKVMFWEISSYVGWNLFGSIASIVRNQGTNIVLNLFFGPVINAARTVSTQVSVAMLSFAQNFSTAFRPRIIKLYSVSKKEEMLTLVFSGTKFIFYLMMMMIVPLFFRMPFILDLWIGSSFSEYTLIFVRLVLIDVLIDSISYPVMAVVQATGKIKIYQIIVGGLLILNLPLAYLFLKLGYSPVSVFVIAIILSIISLFFRVIVVQSIIKVSLLKQFISILIIFCLVLSLSCCFPLICQKYFKNSFILLLAFCFLSVLWSCICVFFVGINKNEKKLVLIKIRNRLKWKL